MLKKKRVSIVFEDDAVIVCEKPAGMPVQSDHTRDMDVLTILKHHIFEEQNSEEEPYLAVVHRLDRPVGGLMVLAKTKEAAANLNRFKILNLKKTIRQLCVEILERTLELLKIIS